MPKEFDSVILIFYQMVMNILHHLEDFMLKSLKAQVHHSGPALSLFLHALVATVVIAQVTVELKKLIVNYQMRRT